MKTARTLLMMAAVLLTNCSIVVDAVSRSAIERERNVPITTPRGDEIVFAAEPSASLVPSCVRARRDVTQWNDETITEQHRGLERSTASGTLLVDLVLLSLTTTLAVVVNNRSDEVWMFGTAAPWLASAAWGAYKVARPSPPPVVTARRVHEPRFESSWSVVDRANGSACPAINDAYLATAKTDLAGQVSLNPHQALLWITPTALGLDPSAAAAWAREPTWTVWANTTAGPAPILVDRCALLRSMGYGVTVAPSGVVSSSERMLVGCVVATNTAEQPPIAP